MTTTCNDNNDNGNDNNTTARLFCYTSTDSYTFTTPVARASQVFAICVLLLLCLSANVLMIYAVLSTRNRGSGLSASSLLLINLAATDLLVGVLVLPMWIVSTATLSWPLPKELCAITAFLTVALMVCSILSLSAIAVDRYLNLAYPLRYPTEMTPQRLAIALVSIWTVCFLVAGLPLCGWGLYRFQPQTVPICNPVWVSEIGFSVFLMLCGLTAPFVIMLVAYVRIVQIAKRHIAKIEATQSIAVGSLTLEQYDSCPNNNNNNNNAKVEVVGDTKDKVTLRTNAYDSDARLTGGCSSNIRVTDDCNEDRTGRTCGHNETRPADMLTKPNKTETPAIQTDDMLTGKNSVQTENERLLPSSLQNSHTATKVMY